MFARDTVVSGAFIYLNILKFGCDNSFFNTGELKESASIEFCFAYSLNTRMIFMFNYDVVCCRGGIIKPYLRGDVTEIIIENDGYKLVVDDNLVIFLWHEIISISLPFIGRKLLTKRSRCFLIYEIYFVPCSPYILLYGVAIYRRNMFSQTNGALSRHWVIAD